MYEDLPTEQPHPDSGDLDLLPPADVARLLLGEERRARDAVAAALPALGEACAAAAAALRAGGRLVYVGAGTSGRLGVLDAAEMGPTFGADAGTVVALCAGAPRALTESVEGREDDADAGARDLAGIAPRAADCVVGITMSGTAAYVRGALDAAAAAGAARVLVTAAPRAPMDADVVVALDLGPEILTGSTRLKGGSATKIVLNALSTAAMAAAGAVYGNLMVRVRPTNRKLRARAEGLVRRLAGLDADAAAARLREAGDDVRVAVVMARRGLPAAAARARLDGCGGSLREALR